MRYFRYVCANLCTFLSVLHICGSNNIENFIRCPYSNLILKPSVNSPLYASSALMDTSFSQNVNFISKQRSFPDLMELYAVNSDNANDTFRCSIPPHSCYTSNNQHLFRSYDGSCNNIQHPDFGMALTRYSRLLPPKYADQVYEPSVSGTGAPLPNARLISLQVFGEETNLDNHKTMALMQFGQFIAHDISELTKSETPDDCCQNIHNKKCYPILLSSTDPIYKGTGAKCLHFARTTSDYDIPCTPSSVQYAEKISMVTGYLDLSSVYGNSKEQSYKTRQFQNGLLKTSFHNNRHWLPLSYNLNGECGVGKNKCYDIPDPRNQFTPNIAVLHTMFQREHNRIARELKKFNPHHSDEHIFQTARKINIAQYQKIVYYDYLPSLLGPQYVYENQLIYSGKAQVNDYDPTVNVAPYAEYAMAAFRYLHNQIPGWFSLVSTTREYNDTLRLSDYMDRSETLDLISHASNFDSLVRGMTTQSQKRADANIDAEVKHYLERKAFDEFGTDLKAIDIQRGRDFGLPSYNDLREFCGLPRGYSWQHFSDFISTKTIALLEKIYASPNDVDLSVGGALENHLPNSLFGPTFQCIVGKQFFKTRKGDRFFFENGNHYNGFSTEKLSEIHKVTLGSLFCINSDHLQYIQRNIFLQPNEKNPIHHCGTFPQINLAKWAEF